MGQAERLSMRDATRAETPERSDAEARAAAGRGQDVKICNQHRRELTAKAGKDAVLDLEDRCHLCDVEDERERCCQIISELLVPKGWQDLAEKPKKAIQAKGK